MREELQNQVLKFASFFDSNVNRSLSVFCITNLLLNFSSINMFCGKSLVFLII